MPSTTVLRLLFLAAVFVPLVCLYSGSLRLPQQLLFSMLHPHPLAARTSSTVVKTMPHLAFVATCGMVAVLTNASLPACIVMAVAGYLFYVCLHFFG